MIEKLYNLKKTQTDQKLLQKAQIISKIENLDAQIMLTQNQINTATVNVHGAISDFMILTIHKNTMKAHIKEIDKEKKILQTQLDVLIEEIIELQKETEQFGYILEEEKKAKFEKLLKMEQESAEEYVQSKYIME